LLLQTSSDIAELFTYEEVPHAHQLRNIARPAIIRQSSDKRADRRSEIAPLPAPAGRCPV